MAYIKDLVNNLADGALDYKITLMGDRCVAIEGFKSIVNYNQEEMVLRSQKKLIHIFGENFKICDLTCGYILIEGKIKNISLTGERNEI